jgi:hypothetical protein
MMTRLEVAADEPTLRPTPVDEVGRTTTLTAGLETLLFALSLVTALPPAAMLAQPCAALPVVRSNPRALLSPIELATVLGRPTAEVGRGRVELREIDSRLHGLAVSLNVFRVTDGSGALISLSVVGPDVTASSDGGATTADLWALTCEALLRHSVGCEYQDGVEYDAILVLYGGITAQLVWLAGDRLATASVTSLDSEEAWMIEAARSIAVLLDRRLR